jgi:hypothetical protein
MCTSSVSPVKVVDESSKKWPAVGYCIWSLFLKEAWLNSFQKIFAESKPE